MLFRAGMVNPYTTITTDILVKILLLNGIVTTLLIFINCSGKYQVKDE